MSSRKHLSDIALVVRRAFAEFLTLPTIIIGGFLLLAVGSYLLDRTQVPALAEARQFLRARLFGSGDATSRLLAAVAGGLITVTSITVSVLLVALQQSASSLTAQVFDQFLRRRINQVYFGFFVGLALYALITLATVSDTFNPVWGATLTFVLTVLALYLVILLLYTTINQMRPAEIVAAIHDHTLVARERQRRFLARTRRVPRAVTPAPRAVTAERHGYVTRIDLEPIAAALGEDPAVDVEIVLTVAVGSFVAHGDTVATVSGRVRADAGVAQAVRSAIHLEPQRDISLDPEYGVEQIETIAWTSISTSKSNPAPGLLAIRALRDLLARWSGAPPPTAPDERRLPVVYVDRAMPRLLRTFETLAVVSSDSLQHQIFGELARSLALVFPRLSVDDRAEAERVVLRVLAALGEHVLTSDLDDALAALIGALDADGRRGTAAAVQAARDDLARSVGRLASRSTRVPRSA